MYLFQLSGFSLLFFSKCLLVSLNKFACYVNLKFIKVHCIGCYIYNNDLSVNLIYSLWLMMMFETSEHVPKTEKHCCVFKNIYNTCAIKTVW